MKISQEWLVNKVKSTPPIVYGALILAIAVSFPQVREWAQLLRLENDRIVLAKVVGDLTGEGETVNVYKVKTPDSLAIEVYFVNALDSAPTEIKRIVLEEKRDAFFSYRGRSVNLVLEDEDGDGVMEIIVPAYDNNLVPRVLVYKFSPESRTFSRFNPPQVGY